MIVAIETEPGTFDSESCMLLSAETEAERAQLREVAARLASRNRKHEVRNGSVLVPLEYAFGGGR